MCKHWLGDRTSMEVDLGAIAEIAETLKQPVHLWELAGVRAMLALAEGRFEDGQSLSEEAFTLGTSAIPDQAISHYCMHRYALYEFRGGLDELEREVAELVSQQPARPVFACAHAHLLSTLGREEDARRVLARLVDALPFDQEWLFGMSLLAEAAVRVNDHDLTAASYDALAPWTELNAADQAEGSRGSIARNLGQLATALRRWDEAADHFDTALAMNERMGYRPWLARTQDDYARLLRLRADDEKAAALEAAALHTYDELGIGITRPGPAPA
jgi:tetratricopeptide (TPR) repeat protein